MKLSLKGKGASAVAAMVGAVLALAAAIGCVIYGSIYEQYSDYVVVICLVVGALLLAAYALIDNQVTDWFGLVSVVGVSAGLAFFVANSYNVWADTWGNILQYGSITGDYSFFNSQGGPIPALVLILLTLAAAICGVVCCFSRKQEGNQ